MYLLTSSLRLKSLTALGLILCATSAAFAADLIGSATEINRSVTSSSNGHLVPMSVGDALEPDETVLTDGRGEARLLFVDATDITIFAHSTLKLDQFLLASPDTASSVILSTADGSYAFNTGHSPHGVYRIDTSAGTITPRGTKFSFTVRDGRLKLDLQEGELTFCPRDAAQVYCVDMRAGQSVLGRAGALPQIVGMGDLRQRTPPSPSRHTQGQSSPPAPPPHAEGPRSPPPPRAQRRSAPPVQTAAPVVPAPGVNPIIVIPRLWFFPPYQRGVRTGPPCGRLYASNKPCAPDGGPTGAAVPPPAASPVPAPHWPPAGQSGSSGAVITATSPGTKVTPAVIRRPASAAVLSLPASSPISTNHLTRRPPPCVWTNQGCPPAGPIVN